MQKQTVGQKRSYTPPPPILESNDASTETRAQQERPPSPNWEDSLPLPPVAPVGAPLAGWSSTASTRGGDSMSDLEALFANVPNLSGSSPNPSASTNVSSSLTTQKAIADDFETQLLENRLKGLDGTDDSLLTQASNMSNDVKELQKDHPELANIPAPLLQAVRGYTKGGYLRMNPALRESTPDTPTTDRKEYDLYIKATTAGLEALPAYEGLTIRGVNNLKPEDIARYQKGSVVTEAAFTSTTRDEGVAAEFDAPVRFELQSKTGRDISAIAYDASEKEVLFMPGTQFKVDDVTKSGDPGKERWTIRMSEI